MPIKVLIITEKAVYFGSYPGIVCENFQAFYELIPENVTEDYMLNVASRVGVTNIIVTRFKYYIPAAEVKLIIDLEQEYTTFLDKPDKTDETD